MNYNVLGIMSGTSLDGIDLCLVNFQYKSRWKYKILRAKTIKYSEKWIKDLRLADTLSGRDLSRLDAKYGQFIGQTAANFIKETNEKIDLIASHGHTVFHEPQYHYSKQIGHGAYIAAESGLLTVSDFRSLDLAYGGQGAPLVPFGDIHLFSKYKAWLNIGGIANITIQQKDKVIAFDIAAANMVLNYLSQKHFNLPYDENGMHAAQGNTNSYLLNQLNKFDYYLESAPKSLGKEDIDKNIIPIINKERLSAKDILHTYTQHLSEQIIATAKNYEILDEEILITGGGANNQFLISLLSSHLKIILPHKSIIEFKEALIFAFLGLNRLLHNHNVINTVTGAKKANSSGSIYLP